MSNCPSGASTWAGASSGVIRLSLDLDRRSHMSFSVRIAAIRRAAVSAGQVQRLERAPDDPAAVICIEIVEA